jgi:hypothetical protein
MKNTSDISRTDPTAQKLLQLADRWEVEMPSDKFFINLPVTVGQSLRERPAPWWQKGWVYWGTLAGSMAAVMLMFAWQLGTGISAGNHLAKAASEWGLDDYGWERVDEVISQADQNTQQQNRLSSSLQTYGTDVLLEYGVTDQDDYRTATQDLSQDEWQDMLEKISAEERVI